jgi:hypothetical protein
VISRPRGILASSLAGGGGGRDVRVEVVRVSMEPSSKRPWWAIALAMVSE